MKTTTTAVASPYVEIDGDELREARQLSGLDQQDLARKARMSSPYISQLESGTKRRISARLFGQLCDALGVPREDRRRLMRRAA